jgi:hypothetical protein
VNINTGKRLHFVSLTPKDLTGIAALYDPVFPADEKHYVFRSALCRFYTSADLGVQEFPVHTTTPKRWPVLIWPHDDSGRHAYRPDDFALPHP